MRITHSVLLLLLFACSLPLTALAQALPTDSLSMPMVSARAGALVKVPIRLTDQLGSQLGADAGAGRQIQAFALQVTWGSSTLITSAEITHSGLTNSLSPLYESKASFNSITGYLATYDELSTPLSGLTGGGAEIATVSLVVSPLAKVNSYIPISFVSEGTLLSNQSGSVAERSTENQLSLSSGAIRVTKGPALPVAILKALKTSIAGRNGRTKLRFSLLSKAKATLTVRFAVTGTAKASKDYRRLPKTVAIAKGKSFVDLDLVPIAAKGKKGTKTVQVKLSSHKSYLIAPPGVTTVSIKF